VIAYPVPSAFPTFRENKPNPRNYQNAWAVIPALTLSDFHAFLSDESAHRISARGDMQVGE
jgi:hypothetical protein